MHFVKQNSLVCEIVPVPEDSVGGVANFFGDPRSGGKHVGGEVDVLWLPKGCVRLCVTVSVSA